MKLLSTYGLLIAFLYICISFARNEKITSNIKHQIHSNNDLNEFESNLLKGSTSFKLDPHYLISSKCPPKKSTSNGCLLLNHDYPDFTLNSNFNSTDDLIVLLKSNRFQQLRQNQTITIALCFKSAPALCQEKSALFQSWLALVDNLHERILNEVTGVEIILDGNGKPFDCLVGRWLPWNSVWISTDLSVTGALTSNSVDNDFYRFQILNDPESLVKWTNYTTNDYYKFSNSTYPYQLWEPDSQTTLSQYSLLYKYGTLYPAPTTIAVPEHQPGFVFAINIDLTMFQIYTGEVSGHAVNRAIANFSKDEGKTDLWSPFIVNIESGVFLYCRQTGNIGDALQYSFVQVDAQYPALSDSAVSQLKLISLPMTQRVQEVSINVANSSIILLLQDSSVISVTYSIATRSLLSASVKISAPHILQENWSSLDLLTVGDSSLLVLALNSSVSGRQSLRLVQDNGISDHSLFDTSTDSIITDAKFLLLPSDIDSALTLTLHLIVFVAVDGNIISGLFKYDMSTLAVQAVRPTPWVMLSVGTTLSVSRIDDVISLVNSDGYCYNSKDHNTRAFPSTVCSSVPTSTLFVLDYSIGLESTWIDILSNSNCAYDTSTTSQPKSCAAITACTSILHGSFDQGSLPSASLGHIRTNGTDILTMFEVHVGVPSDATVTNTCGEPNHVDGIVLDSFEIDTWVQNLRKFV